MAQQGRIYTHNGSWMFNYKEPTFENGKKVWRNRYLRLASASDYSTVAQVEKQFVNTIRPIREKLDSAKHNPSTSQLVSDFIQNVYFPKQSTVNPVTGAAPLKDSTLYGYKHLFNRHVKPNLNGEVMREIDMGAAQKLLEKIAGSVSLSSRSLSHIKWFLKAVFDVARIERAYDAGLVNPFAEVKLPAVRKPRKPTRYASLDDVIDMIETLDEPAATVVSVAAFAGLRKSEIQGLRWEDLKNGELYVQRTAWRTTKVDESTKTAASKSSVPVIKILSKHLEAHRNGFPPEGFIFVGPKLGKPAGPSQSGESSHPACPAEMRRLQEVAISPFGREARM
jgi:hypothetical protein